MSYALFSILPLMIGVFGGTISVIVVIKNVGNNRVEGNLAAIEKMLTEMAAKKVANDTNERACKHRNKVEYCRTVFGMCTLIPIIIFALWIIAISFCVSLNGDCIGTLNSSCNHNSNKIEKDVNQAEEPNSPSSSLCRRVVDSTTELVGGVLLNAHTIASITFVDLSFIIISLLFLRRSNTQYKEVKKIYDTFVENLPKEEEGIQRTGGKP